jgi:hypothetical protein
LGKVVVLERLEGEGEGEAEWGRWSETNDGSDDIRLAMPSRYPTNNIEYLWWRLGSEEYVLYLYSLALSIISIFKNTLAQIS